jgi:hypothetical protein
VKYNQPIGIQQISTEIPKNYSLLQNYPNPFNPNTKIKFQIARSGIVKIVVYDIQGREIEILVDKELRQGTYEADFDGIKQASGVYFYKLITENFADTKKMMIVK